LLSSSSKFALDAKILIEQAEQATQEAVRWKQVADNTRKSHNKNHYQAMLDDTNNIYFYRIRCNLLLSSSSKFALSLNACASSFNEFEPSKSFVESFL
jgi:hypothetical protein